jgi:hypothetical protein
MKEYYVGIFWIQVYDPNAKEDNINKVMLTVSFLPLLLRL